MLRDQAQPLSRDLRHLLGMRRMAVCFVSQSVPALRDMLMQLKGEEGLVKYSLG